jgi:hypothetical protein
MILPAVACWSSEISNQQHIRWQIDGSSHSLDAEEPNELTTGDGYSHHFHNPIPLTVDVKKNVSLASRKGACSSCISQSRSLRFDFLLKKIRVSAARSFAGH